MLHLLDFAVRRCLRDIALQKKYPCLAMPDDTSTNLEHQVYRHERELELDGKDIEKLKKEIAALKHDVGRLDRDSRSFQSCPILPSQYTVPIGEGEAGRHRCPASANAIQQNGPRNVFLLPWLSVGEPETLPLEPSVNAQEHGLYRLESPLTCNTSGKIWPANTPGVLPCRLASALTSSIVDCCKVQ